ncbi:MAG TPA: hypothetical protein VHQ64_12500 [Pyrinomonadaceae bacterium]|nr:hypothetical protein [Pyrinomonadaceae bacterium]
MLISWLLPLLMLSMTGQAGPRPGPLVTNGEDAFKSSLFRNGGWNPATAVAN